MKKRTSVQPKPKPGRSVVPPDMIAYVVDTMIALGIQPFADDEIEGAWQRLGIEPERAPKFRAIAADVAAEFERRRAAQQRVN